MQAIEWIFLISGGMTIAYMCKLFVAVFLEKNQDEKLQAEYDAKKKYMNLPSTIALTVSAVLFPIMGILPGLTMDKMADMSEGFMGWDHAGHSVDYFTWTNLQGSIISIVIGFAIYFLIVRTLLMKKQADGSRVYVNRWWKYLDLEDYFYRPVLLKFIPAVAGTFCLVMDRLVDGTVVLLRKTIYKDSPYQPELDEGNVITHGIGAILNKVQCFLNHTVWRNAPKSKDYEHHMAMNYSSFKENWGFIGRSLSYGLILFCLGLCAVLIYLLLSAVL